MNNKKGAINLPVGVLVSIIFAVTLFAGGIYFLSSITQTTERINEVQAEKQTTERIRQQLQQEEKVAIAPLQKELKPEEHFLFTLNVVNTREQTEDFRFEIELIDNLNFHFVKEQWFVYDSSFTEIPKDSQASWNFLIRVPQDVPAAKYSFLATVYDAEGNIYGNPQSFSVIILGRELKENEDLRENQELKKTEEPDCAKDFSCDAYFIFVPLGDWPSEENFKVKAEERWNLFKDITEFKSKRAGRILVPFDFTKNCYLNSLNKDSAKGHLEIKQCADRYADSLGIVYEKAIGLSSKFEGGKTFFGQKVVYASLGFASERRTSERPGIVAHELGHSYYLCDEYDLQTYHTQKEHLKYDSCKNEFPSYCQPEQNNCLGNTPTYRDYTGESLLNVCQGSTHYSVMGFSTGAECGFDATGGYNAIK